jgi:hypothetical protein
MTLVSHPPVRWSLCVLWSALALFWAGTLDTSSLQSWLALAAIGTIPPGVLLALWNDGPPATVAEVLHTTEGRR